MPLKFASDLDSHRRIKFASTTIGIISVSSVIISVAWPIAIAKSQATIVDNNVLPGWVWGF